MLIFQQRPADPFGATPFLPPPPASSKSHRGSQGRYQFPPATAPGTEQQQTGVPSHAPPTQGSDIDRYAVFDSLLATSSSNGFRPTSNISNAQPTQGKFFDQPVFKYSNSLVDTDSFYTNFTNTHFEKVAFFYLHVL